MTRILAAIAIAAFLAAALGHAAPQADRAEALIAAVNAQRRAHRLPALVRDTRLARAAAAHARDLASTGRFDHEGSDGSSVGDRVRRAGYRWSHVAENLAHSRSGNAAAVVRLWMQSSAHRRNLLNGNLTHAGAAETDSLWVLVLAASAR